MIWLKRIDRAIGRFFTATVGFDYVDRLVLFVFLFFNFFFIIYLLDQHLAANEVAELSVAVDLVSYLLLYFMIHPVVRLVLDWFTSKVDSWINERKEGHHGAE